jgi:hypothetical protein
MKTGEHSYRWWRFEIGWCPVSAYETSIGANAHYLWVSLFGLYAEFVWRRQ